MAKIIKKDYIVNNFDKSENYKVLPSNVYETIDKIGCNIVILRNCNYSSNHLIKHHLFPAFRELELIQANILIELSKNNKLPDINKLIDLIEEYIRYFYHFIVYNNFIEYGNTNGYEKLENQSKSCLSLHRPVKFSGLKYQTEHINSPWNLSSQTGIDWIIETTKSGVNLVKKSELSFTTEKKILFQKQVSQIICQ